MKQTINELSKLLRPDNNFTGDYSFYGVVQSEIRDGDDKVTGYNVRVGESLIEARKLAGADIGDVVLCTTLSNGVTVISGTLDGDKDAVHAGELAESTNNYFWFTSSNTGFGKGAHITQKTQAEVLDDPTNAGGNVLIDSDSLDIRDGENILATFSADRAMVGSAEKSNIELGDSGITARKGDGSEYFQVGLENASVRQDASVSEYFPEGGSQTAHLDANPYATLYGSINTGDVFDVRIVIRFRYYRTSWPYGYVNTSTSMSWSGVVQSLYRKKGTTNSWTDPDRNTSSAKKVASIYYNATNNTFYANVSKWYFSQHYDTTNHPCSILGVTLELKGNIATPAPSYSFGINTDASKPLGFAIGNGTIPSECGFACGKYNEEDTNDEYAVIVGNGTENTLSNAMTLSWDGDLAISGKHQALYKITTVAVETGSIDADSYKSSQNYPMTEVDGYNAVGIVGWSTSNWRIQPTSHYISSNTQLYAGFANYKSPPSSGTSSASATITFRVLWLKATSA